MNEFPELNWMEGVKNNVTPSVISTTYSIGLENVTSSSSTTNYTIVNLLADSALDPQSKIINNAFVQASFSIVYVAIFVIGIFGNVLVCYVVYRNKAMHTVTNLFITNLALSDILLCILAVPFTPMYTFLGRWVFGRPLCHLVPYAQGVSVYISTLTLTSIAMDRFIVIIYPFRHRMKMSTCIWLITSIWIVSLLVTLPYGLSYHLITYDEPNVYYCEENWSSENIRKIYGTITVILQFVLPFLIISICYILVSIKLNDRAKSKPGTKTSKKEEADRDRKRRTNRMLISMVGVFGMSWLPLNAVNIFNDYYETKSAFYIILFFLAHCLAMSSTCYNPFLYAWLNENFRKEFKQVLPFFNQSNSGLYNRVYRPDRTFCNGNDGGESLLHGGVGATQSTRATEIIPRGPTCNSSIKKMAIVKPTIQTNDGFSMEDVIQPTNKANAGGGWSVQTLGANGNNTKILETGVLETPFDVIASINNDVDDDANDIINTTNNNQIENL